MPQTLTTKIRNRIGPPVALGRTTEYDLVGGVITPLVLGSQEYAHLYVARESLTSVGHKRPFREGGPFQMTRYSMSRTYVDKQVDVKAPTSYSGALKEVKFSGVTIDKPTGSIPLVYTDADLKAKYTSMVSFPTIDLNTYGPRAIEMLSPLRPTANLGQFLGELREGLPGIPLAAFRKAQFFKSLGSEYLRTEFGWKPFIKDLQDMYKTWESLNSRMAQIIRDNGKPVRRKVTLKHEVITQPSTETVTPCRLYPNMVYEGVYGNEQALLDQVKTVRTEQTKEFIWAVGRTRYYIPDVTDDQWTTRAKLALFGLNPTPSLIYELMPWSWLIDWFSNAGSVISNWSSNGIADLVIDYAYIMRSFKKETTYSTFTYPTYASPWGGGTQIGRFNPVTLVTKETEERKERIAASPFGFGLQIGSLSARQFAILTALGLSRQNFL